MLTPTTPLYRPRAEILLTFNSEMLPNSWVPGFPVFERVLINIDSTVQNKDPGFLYFQFSFFGKELSFYNIPFATCGQNLKIFGNIPKSLILGFGCFYGSLAYMS